MKSSSKRTSTQTIDPFIREGSQQAVGLAGKYATRGYTPFGGERVADLTTNEKRASQLAGGLSDRYAPYRQRMAQNYGMGALEQYMNPYREAVIDARGRRITRGFESQLNELAGKRSMMDAWGSDRGTLMEAEIRRNQEQALSDAAAEGYAGAFENAQNAFFRDRESAMQGAALEGEITNQELAALTQTGALERGVNQARNDFAYQQYLEGRDWGPNNLQPLLAAIQAARGNQTTTEKTEEKGSVMSAITGIASVAAGFYTGGAFGALGGLGSKAIGGIASNNTATLGALGGMVRPSINDIGGIPWKP